MNGYTKLFGSIIASTIWRESLETKVVWITMLAMSNKHGIVEASVPGLADMARVSLEETQKALEILAAPDTFSRTKDFEGRRIEATDGGWVILNHAKYREKMSADERREYNRVKQQEFRERQKRSSSTPSQQPSNPVIDGQSQSAKSAHTEADKQIAEAKEGEGAARREVSRIPESLKSPQFALAWAKWLEFWQDAFGNRRSMPFHTADAHLLICQKMGPVQAVQAIENAISRNLREPSTPFGPSGRPAVPEKPRQLPPNIQAIIDAAPRVTPIA